MRNIKTKTIFITISLNIFRLRETIIIINKLLIIKKMPPRKKKEKTEDEKPKKKISKAKAKKELADTPIITFNRGNIEDGHFKEANGFKSELFGRKKEQAIIDDWLNKFLYKPKELDKFALFLEGPPGMGKTSMAIEIFNRYNFRYKEFNTSDVRTQSAIRDILKKMCGTYNVLQMMYMKKEEPIGIILDEIDGLCNSTEKSAIQELITVIERANQTHNLQHPIICISNYSNEKKMTELKKVCEYVLCENPNIKDYYNFIASLEEKNKITIVDSVKKEMINNGKTDFRQLKVNFDNLLSACNKRGITAVSDEVFNEVKMSFKDQDIMLYDALADIFTRRLTYEKTEKYFNYEAFMLPFLIHENVVYNIFRCNWVPLNVKLNKTYEALTSFSQYDEIQNGIYEKQNWELSDVCALLTSVQTNSIMAEILDMKKDNVEIPKIKLDFLPKIEIKDKDDGKKKKTKPKKKKDDDCDDDDTNELGDYSKLCLLKDVVGDFPYEPRLKYSLLLNKISLYYTHKKIYQNLTEMSPLSTHDFRTVASLIYACFFENKVDIAEVVDIFLENDIEPEYIESILRLGHFKNKKKFTNRMKNDFLDAFYKKKPKVQIETVFKDKTKEELKEQRKQLEIKTEDDDEDISICDDNGFKKPTRRKKDYSSSESEMKDIDI